MRKFPTVQLTLKKNDDVSILSENYDAIIISPGPGLPFEAGVLLQAIEIYKANVPIFGICLGLQAIVESYGGALLQLPIVYHGIRNEIHTLGESQLLQKMPTEFYAGRYHSWIADKTVLPQELIITAEDEHKVIMAIEHRKHPVYAVQFHPESYMTDEGHRIMQNFIALATQWKNCKSLIN